MMNCSLRLLTHTIEDQPPSNLYSDTTKPTFNLDSPRNGCLGKTGHGDVPKDPRIAIRT